MIYTVVIGQGIFLCYSDVQNTTNDAEFDEEKNLLSETNSGNFVKVLAIPLKMTEKK